MRRSRKPVWAEAHRGFESLPLRHHQGRRGGVGANLICAMGRFFGACVGGRRTTERGGATTERRGAILGACVGVGA